MVGVPQRDSWDPLMLEAGVRTDHGELVELRRARHAEYAAVEIPSSGAGFPPAVPRERNDESVVDSSLVRGIGVGPGVVEGRARVLFEPP